MWQRVIRPVGPHGLARFYSVHKAAVELVFHAAILAVEVNLVAAARRATGWELVLSDSDGCVLTLGVITVANNGQARHLNSSHRFLQK